MEVKEKRMIGITTTVPIEIIYAAGVIPVDLNNIFISNVHRMGLIERAEIDGFPRNFCSWIKGLYSIALDSGIEEVIGVTQGDCSNARVLMEVYQLRGIKTIPFAYPLDRDEGILRLRMEQLINRLHTSWECAHDMKVKLDRIRAKVYRIDEMTWKENLITGFENHYYNISTSDMEGDFARFEEKVDRFLKESSERKMIEEDVRLGYIGVPPIIEDLYQFIEENGGRVIYNEVQRQFSMPFKTDDLVEQYRLYTYPYDIFKRIEDIRKEIDSRKINGLIHYVQSFCHRQIEDIIIRDKLDIPILTLECDIPSRLDARSKIRIESFIDMLKK
ncbi:MAG: 2-hydroxyacyl-CoA dehydratase family protein [Nitrospinota bacterium]